MRLKKIALSGCVLMVAALPVLARADLTINNNTDYASTVRIMSSPSQKCSDTFPNREGITPAHTSVTRGPAIVRILCMGSKNFHCTANVFASDHCEGGDLVGQVWIDMRSLVVTVNSVSPNYTLVANGSTVTIGQQPHKNS